MSCYDHRSCAIVLSLVLVLGAVLAAKDGDKPNGPPPGKDAFVLDLAGDGIDLSGVVTSKLLGDAPVKVHWTKANTHNAFLVLDADALAQASLKVRQVGKQGVTGVILFRGDLQVTSKKDAYKSNVQTVGGVWQALRDLDTNRDGKLNSLDPGWACLKVWVDKDGDGGMTGAELQGMEAAGVKEITLPMGDPDATAKNDDAGNQRVDGEFVKKDGKTGVASAVTLAPAK